MQQFLRVLILAVFGTAGLALAVAVALTLQQSPESDADLGNLVPNASVDLATGPNAMQNYSGQPGEAAGNSANQQDGMNDASRGIGSEVGPAPWAPVSSQLHSAVANQIGVNEVLKQTAKALEQQQLLQADRLKQVENLIPSMLKSETDDEPGAPPRGTPAAPPVPSEGELLPAPERAVTDIQVSKDGLISVRFKETTIADCLNMLDVQTELNIVSTQSVTGRVQWFSLKDVTFETAFAEFLRVAGYESYQSGSMLYVGNLDDITAIRNYGDKVERRIYYPNYVSARELSVLITPFLSQGGTVVTNSVPEVGISANATAAGGDDFAGSEVVIVQDFASSLWEIDQIVRQVDRRPLQVSIEAMILSVKLDDSNEMGVNFEFLRDNTNSRLITNTAIDDLGNISLTGTGVRFGILSGSVSSLVTALESVGDTNVIAAPRLICLNKQRAEILIGSELGYVSTTVTENASTQAVEFLEVGTQLRIRPYISSDGIVRMEVHPELSTGSVRIEQGFTLPDKEVTQVTTNVSCRDGHTVILGGLIREDLVSSASQVPLFGSLPYLGPLFRSSLESTDRNEIIVLLTPRIIHDPVSDEESAHYGGEFDNRTKTFADKMNPIGKRAYARRYLRLARAAWNAGDANAALRYANLSIHFNRLDRDAISLREMIVTSTNAGDRRIDMHLREGLAPLGSPRRDYSRQGHSWSTPGLFDKEPASFPELYHPGRTTESYTIQPYQHGEQK
jgi:type IV pilus assembly protein PilQ